MARTNFYSRNYEEWPAVPVSQKYNPESRYWQMEATSYAERLKSLIGNAKYQAEIDYLIQDKMTWQEIAVKLQDRIEDLSISES